MTPEELRSIKSDKVVDARGVGCPGPILAAKKAVVGIRPGQIMEVLSSDPGTNKDIPVWSKKVGHDFLGFVEESGYWKLFVRRVK